MIALLSSTLATTASIIDVEALLDTAIASVLAGVGVTAAASTAIYGFATFAEMRLEGRSLAALGAGFLGIVAALVFTAAIVMGLIVMVNP